MYITLCANSYFSLPAGCNMAQVAIRVRGKSLMRPEIENKI